MNTALKIGQALVQKGTPGDAIALAEAHTGMLPREARVQVSEISQIHQSRKIGNVQSLTDCSQNS
jgi:hypothetical protein